MHGYLRLIVAVWRYWRVFKHMEAICGLLEKENSSPSIAVHIERAIREIQQEIAVKKETFFRDLKRRQT